MTVAEVTLVHKRIICTGWVMVGAITLWLAVSYLSGFMSLVRILDPMWLTKPPDGVGRYMYFSTEKNADRILGCVFSPLVRPMEQAKVALYWPHVDPGFYDRTDVKDYLTWSGWRFFLGTTLWQYPFAARALAVLQVLATGVLVWALVCRWKARIAARRCLPQGASSGKST